MRRKPNIAKMTKQIDAFNLQYKVGDKISYYYDDGTIREDEVKYPATIMGGHTPVMWLKEAGSFLMDRVVKTKGRKKKVL
jgi:hypothetical protein